MFSSTCPIFNDVGVDARVLTSLISSIKGSAIGQVLADTGAFLKDLDLFDHMEFGITAKDAKAMPLGVRKLIETAFLSFVDAGIDYRGKNVGCYMAGTSHDIFTISGHVCTDPYPSDLTIIPNVMSPGG